MDLLDDGSSQNTAEFSSDNRYFAGFDGGRFAVYSLENDTVIFQPPIQGVRAFRFIGSAIAVAINRQVEVYSLPDGRLLQQIVNPEPVSGILFTTKDEIVMWGGSSVQLKRWWYDPAKEACGRLSRNLSKREWLTYFGREHYHRTCPNLIAGM